MTKNGQNCCKTTAVNEIHFMVQSSSAIIPKIKILSGHLGSLLPTYVITSTASSVIVHVACMVKTLALRVFALFDNFLL